MRLNEIKNEYFSQDSHYFQGFDYSQHQIKIPPCSPNILPLSEMLILIVCFLYDQLNYSIEIESQVTNPAGSDVSYAHMPCLFGFYMQPQCQSYS